MIITLKCNKSGYSARFTVNKKRGVCYVEDFDSRDNSLGYPQTTDIAGGRKLWKKYTKDFGYIEESKMTFLSDL